MTAEQQPWVGMIALKVQADVLRSRTTTVELAMHDAPRWWTSLDGPDPKAAFADDWKSTSA